MEDSMIKRDCRHFRGDVPCRPHKEYGVHCSQEGRNCKYYEHTDSRILIIKLGAVGDVIRTTPLLTRLKKEYPNAKIFWLTQTPEVVPSIVDRVFKADALALAYITSVDYILAINLDKDYEACALLSQVKAETKKGFWLRDGLPYPADANASQKYMTGIFDDLNKKNDKSYLEEMFGICGFSYSGEKYILNNFTEYKSEWKFDHKKKIVGLNTGCGGRWTSRLWPEKYWIKLAEDLIKDDYEVLFLGGPQEDEKNKRLAKSSGGSYIGYFPLPKFINLIDQCDVVVSSVTMAMHITLALGKKLILFNNIFNPKEFELFGIGEIIAPEKECTCFFSAKCHNPEYSCMESLYPDVVFKKIKSFKDL
jgi:heptosyltransferase-2